MVQELERPPGDNRLGFSYNPDSVLRYVTADGVSRSTSQGAAEQEGGTGDAQGQGGEER